MVLNDDPQAIRRLERRMQFVLGPRTAVTAPGWRSHGVAGGLCLSAHPDLNVTTVTAAGVTLTLLGFVLDPAAPAATDADVLGRLAAEVAEGGDLFESLATLGGRYLLIVGAGLAEPGGAEPGLAEPGRAEPRLAVKQPMVVGDASGSLQLFYATVAGETWCAAQPDLLATLHGFSEEPEAVEYIESLRATWDEYFWPADSSPYAEVRRLLPNHFLELAGGVVRRYWPWEPLAARSVAAVVEPIGARLTGLMRAATHRFDLSMGVSCGLDSRLMLAATRGVVERMVYYTGQSKRRNARHPDVAIPRAMLAAIGAEHHVIVSSGEVSPEFADLFARSVPYAHMQRAPGLERQYARYQLSRVAVIGNTSENARGIYRSSKSPPIPEGGMNAGYCARLTHLNHPFAERQFARWVAGLGELHGYDPRELLYWENRSGSWFAGNVTEFLSAWQDVFLPFNCRALLLDIMAAPSGARVRPATELYTAVVADLWPELLRYPINPVSLAARLRKRTYLTLRGIKRGLLGMVADAASKVPAVQAGSRAKAR